MRYKKKLIFIFILVIILTGIQAILPYYPKYVYIYNHYVFRPYQSARNTVLGIIPFSVGDILYIIGFCLLAVMICRWVYFIIKFKTHKHYLGHSMLHAIIAMAVLYLFFFIGWGGNYYKASLTTYWDLDKSEWSADSTLVSFDKFLVGKMNQLAPHYKELPFAEVDARAKKYYRQYTNGRTRQYGLHVKASIFGYMMQHLAIQGYYNPFTGEAQANKYLPSFMLPYVVAHEMAHQSGIAAEEDANLLAYVIGREVKDTTFNYSAYLNLWLYTNSRLYAADSLTANAIKDSLNAISRAHLDTLRAIRRRYKSEFSNYSGQLYDGYLKMHNQKDGILSYNRVASSAWAWEQRKIKDTIIRLP